MVNKETAMKLGTLIMGALPEVERCAVISSAPLGHDGYIITIVAHDETQVNIVYNETEPDTLWELDEIPDAKPGYAAAAVLREFGMPDSKAFRWPNAVRAALGHDWNTLAALRELPDWNGNPTEFLTTTIADIRIARIIRYDASGHGGPEDAWECLALDRQSANPDTHIRATDVTPTMAIMSVVAQIVRNRSAKAAVQRKLENMDDSTLNA